MTVLYPPRGGGQCLRHLYVFLIQKPVTMLPKPTETSRGAILYQGKYGSTRQYAEWIGEATGLPVFNLAKETPDLDRYDFLILGSAVYVGRMKISQWLAAHWEAIKDKPVLLFSVSGTAPEHPGIEDILTASLTPLMLDKLDYQPLRGRLRLEELSWLMRFLLKLGARIEKDEEARQRMRTGFDFVKRENIRPILAWVREVKAEVAG